MEDEEVEKTIKGSPYEIYSPCRKLLDQTETIRPAGMVRRKGSL